MTVAEVQQRIALIQATARSFAPPVRIAPGRSFAAEFDTVMKAQGSTAPTGDTGADAVELAKEHLGTPYVWGGTTPKGFDCSGLIQYVYKKLGVDLPRVSRDQARAGVPVEIKDLQKGDLIAFGSPVDHIGIYAGDGKMVVAPKRGDVVKIQDVDFDSITAARRVTGEAPAVSRGSLDASKLPLAARPYAAMIERAAAKAGIDPKLLAALAWSESNFRPDAVSSAGAIGMTQLMPATAQGMGVDPYDAEQNLEGGAKYLAVQLRRFGRVDHALAAYNAGPTAVRKAGGIPPYAETQGFVQKVLARTEELS
ncbi:MAG: NlpC/P60 family protein [Acidimicrobiales bacterium]|nr:NlpC/P60 family protein [Acidimicrobiales bacterium]